MWPKSDKLLGGVILVGTRLPEKGSRVVKKLALTELPRVALTRGTSHALETNAPLHHR